METEKVEIYGWAKSVDRFFYTLFHLVTYFVTTLAKHALKMVSESIVLVVPFPNAVSVFYLSQHHLGFGFWQAMSMAAGIEVVVFFMVGISLHLLGGWLLYGKRWLIPLTLVTVATIAVIGVVIRYVYYLESISEGHTILAWLPALSIGAFIALGVQQWHDRQVEVVRELAGKPVKLLRNGTRQNASQNALSLQNNALPDNALTHYSAHTNGFVTAAENASPSGVKRSEAVLENVSERSETESSVLKWLQENPGEHKVAAVSGPLGLSKSTAARHLASLVTQGLVSEEYVGNSYRYRYVGG